MIKSKRMRLVVYKAHMGGGGRRNACKIVAKELEGKRPLRRTRCRWDDNIDHKESVNWIHLAQNEVQRRAIVNTGWRKASQKISLLYGGSELKKYREMIHSYNCTLIFQSHTYVLLRVTNC
jgi:hypothetical protein